MASARVCFLWHMHQPSYFDATTGALVLPWVRMHAARGYLDMARMAARYPGVHHTFNLTPCLLDQLEGLASGRLDDDVRVLCRKPAADLGEGERAYAVRHFFSVAFEHNVRPLPRYAALLAKRGELGPGVSLPAVARTFSVDELRDLSVLFHLAWCGHSALREDEGLAALRRKGSDYTEADKDYVLSAFDRLVASILPAYRALAAAGHVELSSTPYFHPILPLLVDSNVAQRPRPDRALPPRFAFPEDAREQVLRAAATHAVRFGRPPTGMWPAEGSVSPEVVPLFEDAGLSWIATDEAVLFRSLPDGSPRAALHRPWRLPGGAERLACFFRDHALSDLFGFTYYRRSPEEASADFLGHVDRIARAAPDGETPTVSVILDGENPWEHYPESGERHLDAIFGALERTPVARACSFTEALAESKPALLPKLHTGSWIESSFRIWIGGDEENRAWSLLREAREAVAARPTAPKASDARDHLLAAEGSDWFWWYGDDFASEQKPEFDRLFRARLAAAYGALGLDAPASIREPVLRARAQVPAKAPTGAVAPRLGEPSVLGWIGAGRVDFTASRQAMFGGAPRFSALLFGGSGETAYLRFIPGSARWRDDLAKASVRVELRGEGGAASIHGPLQPTPGLAPSAALTVAVGDTLELAVRVDAGVARPGQPLELAVLLEVPGAEAERFPAAGWLAFALPDPARSWMV